jgi:uncharacterized protein YegP (UPF0339 family)
MSEELAQPYSIEVEKERGGFRWKLRARGKLMVRSQHLYRTAEKAQEEGLEQLQRLQHGAHREKIR